MTKYSVKYMGNLALGLALAALGLSLTACNAPTVKPAITAPVVLVSGVSTGAEDGTIVTGTVESLSHHLIASETGGRLLSVAAQVGDRVRQGQTLAIIDPQRAALQLRQSEADLARAQADDQARQQAFARAAKLIGDGTVSQADYERAAAEAASARQAVQAAMAARAMAARTVHETVLRAPANGIIVARNVQPSQIAAPGAVLFELDGGGMRDIKALVPADAARRLTIGQTVRFQAGGMAGTARVAGVSTETTAGGAVATRFSIDGAAPAAGTPVSLRLDSANGDAVSIVAVPMSAVTIAANGMRNVFVVGRDNRVAAVPVTLTALSGQQAFVSGPLASDAQVIIAGTDWVKPGLTVRPQIANR